jgi:hypothetical protein
MIRSFYNFALIMSLNAMFNFVIGGRGLGKTYGMKKKAINDGIRKGAEFIYLRRFDKELIAAKGSFFADIAHLWPKYEFRVNGNRGEFTKVIVQGSDETDQQFEQRRKKRPWTTLVYFVALTTTQRYKSVNYPKVTLILFDEFIIEKGSLQYLSDEVTIFINFYSTVDRWKDKTRVFFLANSVSIMNPYFIKWDIRPDQAGEIIVKADGYVACHFPDSEAFRNEVYQTAFGKFIQDSEYAEYAVGNGFADNHDLLIKGKPADAKYIFTLETKNGTFSVWTVRVDGEVEYFMQDRLTRGNAVMRTLIAGNVTEDKYLMKFNDMPLATLRTAWRQGRVWFDNQKTRNTFIDIFERG